ncbi:MAG TPA: glycosyltransferase family 4 protein [Candidatus Bipolaricaulota bacterium]|nr:glycosyltransferase family 4 protein [Candidatus Bipolaricaulota bacterium]
MKILYLITQSTWGGAQRYVYDLAVGMNKEFEVAVACGGDGGLIKELARKKIKVIPLKYLKRDILFLSDIRSYFEIKKLIKEERPDILHVNSSKAGFLGGLAARSFPKTKVVYTVHGSVFTAAFNIFYRWLFKIIEKTTSKHKDSIILVSNHDRSLWLENKICESEKLFVIHNGIDVALEELFLPKERALAALLPAEKEINLKIIGCIANFYAEKNLLSFLSVFKEVSKEVSKCRLILIGDGPLRREIKKYVRENDLSEKVILPGFIKNAWLYLKAFDLFVLPSKKEGFPYTILEALLAKVPVVASRVGGIPEIIGDESTGLLFDSADSRQLAEKMLILLKDEVFVAQLVGNGIKKVKESFNLTGFLDQTKKIYLSSLLAASDEEK